MHAPRPVIALLTDFGLRDHYVAAMKGVILGICPDATLIDITHDIAPQDVLSGALELEAVAPYLPDGTVVAAVVDPGVGTRRRAVGIDAGRLRFVGPDNGLLSLAVRDAEAARAVELSDPRFRRALVSRTFEGRDRFAPAAAWLAGGVALEDLGVTAEGLVTLDLPEPEMTAHAVVGAVLYADRFGNLVTSIRDMHLVASGDGVEIRIGTAVLSALSTTYSEVAPGRLCALIGSTGRLEIAVNSGSAAARLGASRGDVVQVRRRSTA